MDIFSRAGVFLRSKASSQSQDLHDHSTNSCPPTSLADTGTSAYSQTKEMHQKSSQSSSSNVTSTRERELSRKLLEKEIEIEELRKSYEGKILRREHEIRHLRHDQTILQGASDRKDSDLLESSNGFKAMLDEKDKKIEELRKTYSRLLHAQEDQQRRSKTLQREADAEAEALRERLTTVEQKMELCRDDLFRTQPACHISDGKIIAAFESLGEQLVNWIDNETSAFEKAYPGTPVGWLFSGSKDSNVARFLRIHPFAGEYLCRHLVNRCLLEHMFGTNTHCWGLSAECIHMQRHIEHGMAALKPPKGTVLNSPEFLEFFLGLILSDSQKINIWRAETFSALGATQEYKDLRETQSIRWTRRLFKDLSASFPNLFGPEEVMKRFHDQVTIPATALVSRLQGLASPYRLGMVEKNMLNCQRIAKNDLSKIIAIDLETGRTLKPGSAIISDREGVIGDLLLSLEPSLHRVNEGMSETDLRQETWLVRLDHAQGNRAPKVTEEGDGTYVFDDLGVVGIDSATCGRVF